jgi:hypothetical protein
MARPSAPCLRRIAAVAIVLLGTAAFADARGGGGGGGFGGPVVKKGGKKGARASAQAQQLINDTYRRDVVARSRRVDW